MDDDDFFTSEDNGPAGGHSDDGLGFGGGDKVLDYLIYGPNSGDTTNSTNSHEFRGHHT